MDGDQGHGEVEREIKLLHIALFAWRQFAEQFEGAGKMGARLGMR